MNNMGDGVNKLVVSVDLDEWYHARWCTGSSFSRWKTTKDFFRDYYGCEYPLGELVEPTKYILELFGRYNVKGTFFVLGEVAGYYEDLLSEVVRQGHEVACHGLYHKDMDRLSKEEFIAEVSAAKDIIERIIGQKVQGFRAPNAILPSYLVIALEEMGFAYDSSVFPSRKLGGKYGYTRAPLYPYFPSRYDIQSRGQSTLVELPVAVFPGIRLVAGSGIFTRLLGYWWTRSALRKLLSKGSAVYYFHPYELMPAPKLSGLSFRERIFLRKCGNTMRRYVEQLLRDFNGRFTRACELVKTLKEMRG